MMTPPLVAGYAKAKMFITDYHLNGVNAVHGGAIFTLADFTFAAGINATVAYTKAVSTGVLFAEARELSLNHKLGNCPCKV